MDWTELKARDFWYATDSFWGACRGAAEYVADHLRRDEAYRAHLANVALHSRPDLKLEVVAEYNLESAWQFPQLKPFSQPIWGGVEEMRELAVVRPLERRPGRVSVVRPSDGCYPSDVVACALCLDAAAPVPVLARFLKKSGHLLTMQLVEGVASKVTYLRDNPAKIGDFRSRSRFFFEGRDGRVYVGELFRQHDDKWGLTVSRFDKEFSRAALPANYLLADWAAWPLTE